MSLTAGCSVVIGTDDLASQPRHDAAAAGADASGNSDGSHDAPSEHTDGAIDAATPSGCPASLPSSWIFCDDFETADVAARYFRFDDAGGAFARSSERAASGAYSMAVTQASKATETGRMTVVFGKNPVGAALRANETFYTLHFRFRVLHETVPSGDPGWTRARHKLAKAAILANDQGGAAAYTLLWQLSPDHSLLGADVARCLGGDAGILCPTWDTLPPPNSEYWPAKAAAVTPIVKPEAGGTWRCIETLISLGPYKASDDRIDVFVDGKQEVSRTGLALRPNYDGHALNSVTIENGQLHAEDVGGPVLRRFIDDFVIATSAIGCD